MAWKSLLRQIPDTNQQRLSVEDVAHPLRREEISGWDRTGVSTETGREAASRLWREVHASRVARFQPLAEQPLQVTGEGQWNTPPKREEIEVAKTGESGMQSSRLVGGVALLGNWDRLALYLLCPVCGARCCSTAKELTEEHIPLCSRSRYAAEEGILFPIGRRAARLQCRRKLTIIPQLATVAAEVEALQRTLMLADAGNGMSPRQRLITAEGQPASPTPASTFADFILGSHNVAALQIHKRLLLPCPMGSSCIARKEEGGGVSHIDMEEHAAACWAIGFSCSNSGGLLVSTGRTVPLSEIQSTVFNKSGDNGVVSVMDALAVCDHQLFRLIDDGNSTTGAAARKFSVGLTRRSDDAVVIASSSVVSTWCCTFAVHFF